VCVCVRACVRACVRVDTDAFFCALHYCFRHYANPLSWELLQGIRPKFSFCIKMTSETISAVIYIILNHITAGIN